MGETRWELCWVAHRAALVGCVAEMGTQVRVHLGNLTRQAQGLNRWQEGFAKARSRVEPAQQRMERRKAKHKQSRRRIEEVEC